NPRLIPEKADRRPLAPVPSGRLARRNYRDTNEEIANDQAPGIQVQDRPPAGHQSVGPAEEPDQQARLRPGPAWPTAQEAIRLWRAADGQAAAQGLLRQYRRAPVPPHL